MQIPVVQYYVHLPHSLWYVMICGYVVQWHFPDGCLYTLVKIQVLWYSFGRFLGQGKKLSISFRQAVSNCYAYGLKLPRCITLWHDEYEAVMIMSCLISVSFWSLFFSPVCPSMTYSRMRIHILISNYLHLLRLNDFTSASKE